MNILEIKDLHVSYGAIKAVKGISMTVEEGEIVTLIGSNGAGKSTIMNTITGHVRASSGEITFQNKNITRANSADIVKGGISLAPEGRQIFPMLTVLENLEMGGYSVSKSAVSRGIERAFTLFPRLKERYKQMGGTLSGGEQQMLAVARALMSEPKLLMLDEPSLGLAPTIIQEIYEMIQTIRKEGTTVLLVEQNARMALKISDRGYVLETGKIVLSDNSASLLVNEQVKNAYLGGLS